MAGMVGCRVLMGRMARPSLIGQALTPVIGGYLFEHFGAMGVLLTLCLLALVNVVLVGAVMRRVQQSRAVKP